MKVTIERLRTKTESRKPKTENCGLQTPSRTQLLAGRLAPHLIENRSHRRSQTAIGRQLEILLISGDRLLVPLQLLADGTQQLVDHRLGVRQLLDRDLIFTRGFIVLPAIFKDSRQSHVRLRLKSVALANRAIESGDRFVGVRRLAVHPSLDR